ncbi:MAG: efflux RND transporter permease subunit [Oscillospiraceae bacterium]|nr:efflux RND transporter permease subunit [Oscillospiraceae bacterium]
MKLHEFSVKKPIAVTMIVLIFFVIGVYSLSMLSIEMMPDMNIPIVVVMTQYSNVAPEEIENLVTKPIEGAVSAVSGIDDIQATSNEGSSLIVALFNNSVDVDDAVKDINERLELVKSMLPDDCNDPMVLKMDTGAMPIAQFSFDIDGYDIIQTNKYVEDNLQPKLEAINGIANVTVTGANDREIDIIVDPEKMFGYDMSMSQIVQAIAAQNQNLPGGNTTGMGRDMMVRTLGKFESVKDIERIPLMTPSGQIIYLTDIATVEDTYSEDKTYARLNMTPALSVSVQKQSDANTVDAVNAVIKVLDEVCKADPKCSYDMTMEQASYIENSIRSVANNAVTGAVLAVIVLLLFLGSLRSSLIIGISMPVAVVTTFIIMYFSKMTLNVVSLGGLALGVGMLVDNSVVVLENIFRHRKELNKNPVEGAVDGSGEVFGAVLASVITTCIVYVPILFIDNIMAIMFQQLAMTIIFSQCASLIVTYLLVPMLTSKMATVGKRGKLAATLLVPFDKMLEFLYVIYERALRTVLRFKKTFILFMVGLFVINMFVLAGLGMTLMPSSDEGSFTVSVETPQGTPLEDTDEIVAKMESIILENENVETVFAVIGSGGMLGGASSNTASLTVTLLDKDKRNGDKTTDDVMNDVRMSLKNIAGAELEYSASSSSGISSSDELSFYFSGDDDDTLEEYVLKAEEILAGINGVTETSTSFSTAKSEVNVNINATRAGLYGLNVSSATNLIYSVLEGTKASEYTEAGKEYDIRVQYPDDYIKNYNYLGDLRLRTPTGQWITLDDIADIEINEGHTSLSRLNQKRTITLKGKLYGVDMGSVTKEFNEKFGSVPVPDGCSLRTGGAYETMMEAMMSLAGAVLLGILLMYMVMAAQFGNLVQPLIIMCSVPLALIGVVTALFIARSPLSVVGCIGILMLSGMIVNNAIVLIDFINTAKEEREFANRTELLVTAGKTRMRPVLMTTLTTILGFLPMVVVQSEGSEMMRPLAVVLLGGLAIGTVLTLLVVPTIYSMIEDKAEKHRRKKEIRRERKVAKAENRLAEFDARIKEELKREKAEKKAADKAARQEIKQAVKNARLAKKNKTDNSKNNTDNDAKM